MKKIEIEASTIEQEVHQAVQIPKIKLQKIFFLKKWISKFSQLPPKKKVIIIGISTAIIVLLGAVLIYLSIVNEGNLSRLSLPELLTALTNNEGSLTNILHTKPDEPKSIESPLNGELFTRSQWSKFSERYPLAVIIENHIDARNQAGFNSADEVYEALAEGGITRTLAIFWSKDLDSLGPIRSARQYFIEWFMPYDPLFMYIGYAEGDPSKYDRRVDVAKSLYEYDIKSLSTGGSFWRVSHKIAPHNAYSSTATLYNLAKKLGYTGKPKEIESLVFKNDAPPEERGESTTATLRFFEKLNNGGIYDVTWKYDRESNLYLRYNANTPYLDENTGETVHAKNVIIMRQEMISTYDFKAHIIITTTGSGDAVLLRDGHVINCTWKKDDLESRIHLYDSDNKEVPLNRGIIWYESVPIDQGTAHIEN